MFLYVIILKEPRESSTTNAIKLNDQPAKQNKDASKFPRGVLDFSSGSEEDVEEHSVKKKASDCSAVGGTKTGNAVSGPDRITLLQHGFSRLLQAVNKNTESGKGDSSPDVEEITSEEDTKDQVNSEKKDSTSSGTIKCSNRANGAVCLPKLGTRVEENGGRQERISLLKQTGDAVTKGLVQNDWACKKVIMDKESDENSSPDRQTCNKPKIIVPKVQQFNHYSDESEDLDIDTMTCHKKGTFSSHSRGGRVGFNRKRLSASERDKARSKQTEDIETFTSSEDEHTPVKKERSKECNFWTSQTDRPRASETDKTRIEKQTRASKTVSFTHLTHQRSPASKRDGGTIDSVLGKIHCLFFTHLCQNILMNPFQHLFYVFWF